MNIVFEDLATYRNFTNYTEEPDYRFKVCPIVSAIIRYNSFESAAYREFVTDLRLFESTSELPDDEKYIIPTGVNYHPHDWCGPDDKNPKSIDHRYPVKQTLFDYLSPQYLKDLQNGRAFLLLDQSHEGYQTEWLWSWFHNMCDKYLISPTQIIYVTGNLDSEKQYQYFADTAQLVNRVKVIGYSHFEMTIRESSDYAMREPPYYNNPVTFQDQIKYKLDNLKNIKSFSALQKRNRAHRVWLFYALVSNGLINHGICSMNDFHISSSFFENRNLTPDDYNLMKPYLPMLPPENPANYTLENFASGDCGGYISSINRETALNSWFGIISEASFGDRDGTCFLSEKTFKPIICSQPFIIFGNKGSLQHLKDIGYRTFSPWINEDYDTLDTWDRYDAIIKEINRLHSMTIDQKVLWFNGMQDMLEHNFKRIYYNSAEVVPPSVKKLKEYFDEKNV